MLTPEYKLAHVDRQCLRCATHFITAEPGSFSMNSTLIDPSLSFYPIDAYDVTSYTQYSTLENNVRASICVMLNEPYGGLVLLGC